MVMRDVPTRAAVEDVHYVVTGDGEHVVVVLHGYSDNLTTWNRVVPRLAVDHRVIAIDLPGFGRTTRPWTRPLLPGYVDAIADVLDAEGVDTPVSFMGNSMGGVVSALFAATHPHRVDRLVLIDMPGLHTVPRLWRVAMSRPAEAGVRAALRFVPHRAARFGLGWVYTRVAAADVRRLDPMARAVFTEPYSNAGRIADLLPLGRTLMAEIGPAKLGHLVEQSAAPVLLVFGSRDVLTPPRVMRRIGRPGGAVVLPGCGHCPQVDQPEALLTEVVPFLRDTAHDVVSVATTA
ncbi:MAG: alpha/beta hydrolase [Jatrophihabitans sp.]